MSYILDALQRADAERERGHVPGLNSQRVPPASRKPVQKRRLSPRHVALAVAAGLCMVLALWWWQRPDVAPTPTPEPAAQAVSQAPAPAPVAAAPEPVLPILAPPRPEPVAPARPAPAAATAKAPAPGATAAAPAAAPAAPAAANPPSATAIRSFADLPPEVRAQLPAVSVSGATYSKDAAVRMLIANGKVVQEGQEIAPGLKLETIGQRSAVLNHQGMRYSIGY
jgi:general secretion pathway protein B